MSKKNIDDLVVAAKKAGKVTQCHRCQKEIIWCGTQGSPSTEDAVCAECVRAEAQVVAK